MHLLSTAAAQSKRVPPRSSEGGYTDKLIKHTVLISEICCPGWQHVYNMFIDFQTQVRLKCPD